MQMRNFRAVSRIVLSLARCAVPGLRFPSVPFGCGRTRIIADLNTPFGLGLYRYGYWHPELELLQKLLQPGDIFIDGGANVGLFTLVAAARVGPTGRVIAIEPTPNTATLLRKNLQLNDYWWVDVWQVALDAEEMIKDFTVFDGGGGLNSFSPVLNGGTSIRVQTVLLDDIVPRYLRNRLALVKLDLEGAEKRALHGAREVLQSVRCPFFVEIEPDRLLQCGSTKEGIEEEFEQYNYVASARHEWAPNVLFFPKDWKRQDLIGLLS